MGPQSTSLTVKILHPLHEAASQKNAKMVEVLHKHGAHINVFDTNGLSPLCVALICNRVDTILYLLKAGASTLPPNPASLSAMHVAAAGGELKAMKRCVPNVQ